MWLDEDPNAENNVMQMIADHRFDLIINIPKNHTKRELTNGYRCVQYCLYLRFSY
jgi:carbamoyl-phosphate synthase large subunit